jgi:hypothetical protein
MAARKKITETPRFTLVSDADDKLFYVPANMKIDFYATVYAGHRPPDYAARINLEHFSFAEPKDY